MTIKMPETEQKILEMSRDYNFYTWEAQKYAMEHLAVKNAEGCYFWDYNGKKYLDAASQLVNVNLGAGNRIVLDAIKAQVDELCYVFPHHTTAPRAMLAKKLITEAAPGMGKVFFCVSGTEANEYAMRIVNSYRGERYKILSQYMSCHGFTYGAANLNGQLPRGTINPGVSGIVHFLGPWWREHGLRFESEEEYTAFLLRLLEKTIIQEDPNKISAIVTETMLGPGGVIRMPKGYFEGVRTLCDKYGIVMVCDEIMTGFGRTGKWFAYQHYDAMPDVVTFAKGVTSGYVPLGGVIVSKKIAEYFEENVLYTDLTYNAHTLCCATALAAMDAYKELNLFENSERMGAKLLAGLMMLCEKHKSILNPRGIGLLTAVDFAPQLIHKTLNDKIKRLFLDKGVLPYVLPQRILITPPLIATTAEIDLIVSTMDEIFTEVDKMF
jgi:taurine--2-oxoglutarate transaminase